MVFFLGETKWIDEEETEESEVDTHIDEATGQEYTVNKVTGGFWCVFVEAFFGIFWFSDNCWLFFFLFFFNRR